LTATLSALAKGQKLESASGEARSRGGLGSLNVRTARARTATPGARTVAAQLAGFGVVIGGTALSLVIVWAVTHWLWLVVHQGGIH
jgi:hypothetical protein